MTMQLISFNTDINTECFTANAFKKLKDFKKL